MAPRKRSVAKYNKECGGECPWCGEEDLIYDEMHFDIGYIEQEVNCIACGRQWYDQYKFKTIIFKERDLCSTSPHRRAWALKQSSTTSIAAGPSTPSPSA